MTSGAEVNYFYLAACKINHQAIAANTNYDLWLECFQASSRNELFFFIGAI